MYFIFNCYNNCCLFGAYTSSCTCLRVIGLDTVTVPHLWQVILIMPLSSCHPMMSAPQFTHFIRLGAMLVWLIIHYPPIFPIVQNLWIIFTLLVRSGTPTPKMDAFVLYISSLRPGQVAFANIYRT